MMIDNARLATAVVTLLLIGVVVSSPAFAQHRPRQHGSGSSQPQHDQTTNLTGTWTLNEDLSDDPAKAMAAMQGEQRDGSGHGPWRHGGGRDGMDPGHMQAMQSAMQAPATLRIAQADGSITFTGSDGRSQTLRTDNKKEKLALETRTVEVSTKWDDGRLVKKTSLGDGMKLTETYSLVAEPRQLHVTVKLEGSRLPRPVNLRRVYDAEGRR